MRTLDPPSDPVVDLPPSPRRRLLAGAAAVLLVVTGSIVASGRAPAPAPSARPAAPGGSQPQTVEVLGAPPTSLPDTVAFQAVTLDGAVFSVPAGRPTVLLFVTASCGACLEEAGELDRLAVRFGGALAFLAVEIDPWESPVELTRFGEAGGGLHFPLAVDRTGAIHRPLRAFALETVVVLDPRGRVVYREVAPSTGAVLDALAGLGLR